MSEQAYLTTPIYYVNAEPHLGHAYTTIVTDVLNRFYMLSGLETFFLTGTDEHGDKIVSSAEKAGETPRAYVDRISVLFRNLWPKLMITNNDFIRTTDPQHVETVRFILNRVNDRGDIYFSDYQGLYCFGCERFLTDREMVGGKCPDHQTEPAILKEANYFFRMSRYQEWLIDHIRKHPDFIRPERYKNEVISFLREPLEDLCISRPKSRLTWGITLPFDEDFVTYVWFDALINYVSALGYPDHEKFKKFWPAVQHFIAKDILKPHGIYWPCMLKSAGIAPYTHLNVHGYWNINEGKMSKSLGNVVRPLELADLYGLDAFRYFLLRDMVFGLDSEFSEEALVNRINSDLANDLGNLVSRTITMVHKYCNGQMPESGTPEEADDELRNSALQLVDLFKALMEALRFHKALIAVWEVIGKVNKYIDTTAPWVLAKRDPERLRTVMFHILETIRIVSALIWPFMPESAEKIQDQLGLAKKGRDLQLRDLRVWGKERPVRALAKAPALFPRIETRRKEVPHKMTTERKASAEEKPHISFDEFQKLDLRIATIREAASIPGSKKLLKLELDMGEERTVVAGLVGHYTEEELRGKQVLVVANLEPIKLMGVQSHGMVLAAVDDSALRLLIPDGTISPGTKVK